MFIPETNIKFCPSALLKRDFGDSVVSTAQSFKSWDTCMDNKVCKIVAIVGIVLAGLVVLWAISTIIRCACLGLTCLEALCCCCCRSASKDYHEKQLPQDNPFMYGNGRNGGYNQGYQPGYQQPSYERSYEAPQQPAYHPNVQTSNSPDFRYEPVGYQVAESDHSDPFSNNTAYKGYK